ncbi:MAG: outer membrane protein assembly factor BamA [Burkholderiaceae bacterium]|jgi:outer membrane protein insertion porin family|nr:outer membrane protein assembly factor BamA [Burkholderiaceae bacterium]MEB2320291.1 outer membrane protein assembly factor BamA [Pseudomonadota bacterium]
MRRWPARGAVAAFLLAIGVRAAFAFEPFVVRDIRIEGIQRTEPGTVFTYLPVKVGDRLTQDRASEAVSALFRTGFFQDVRLEVEGDVLVVFLSERPAIASLEVDGSREFEREMLEQVLRDQGLAESRIFDRSILERAEQELKRQYLSRGKYNVRVTTTITPLERNRVGLSMSIDEGESARITSIRFVGNEVFSDKVLRDQLSLSTPTWLTWYTKSDRYAREKLAGDLEALRSFYLDRGYLEFSIESTQVSISPDREDVHITVVVKEGEQFTVSGFRMEGELLGRSDQFAELVEIKPGDVFSGAKLSASTEAITRRLGELGYAFANVNAVPELDREKRTVAFTIMVDPGRRVYVRRINISGNHRTRDVVIRREMRQFEDAWYDADRIRLSRERIGRLGYFTDVQIQSVPVPEAPDQVDLDVKVTEQTTGNLMLGLGVSSTESVVISGSIHQSNFLGTGKALSLDVNTSRVARTISLSYTDPYFTPDGVSRSFDVYTRLFNASSLRLGDYRWRSNGVGLRFGIPYTEIDRLGFGLAVENNQLTLGDTPPQRYIDFANAVGKSSTNLVASLSWSRDTRDSVLIPTRGRFQIASLETSLPGSDSRYYRLGYGHQYFAPVTKDYTLAFNLDLGYGRAYGDDDYPPFKNYYAGGIGSIRGFDPSSLGPGRDPVDEVPLGGQVKIVGSIEFQMPLAGTGNDRSFRSFFFIDGGNVFPVGGVDTSEFRYSAGVGLSWLSPFGPLKFSLGYPLNAKDGDRTQRLQFQIGTGF